MQHHLKYKSSNSCSYTFHGKLKYYKHIKIIWVKNICGVKYFLQIWHFYVCGEIVRISTVKKHDELYLSHIQQYFWAWNIFSQTPLINLYYESWVRSPGVKRLDPHLKYIPETLFDLGEKASTLRDAVFSNVKWESLSKCVSEIL